MAKQVTKKTTIRPTPKEAEKQVETDFLVRMEDFLEKNASRFFWGIFILSVLLVIGLFEMKIGLANDDALYIEGGVNYSKDFFGYFFRANAPFYPMLLGLFIAIFGFKLVVLKLISSVFFLLSLYWVYKGFKGRIPYAVLFGALFITATNSLFVMHASLTYTECFFAAVQALFLWVFLKLTDVVEMNPSIKASWKSWLFFGLSILLAYMSRNVAIAIVFAVLAFFLLRKQWLNTLYALIVSVIFMLVWEALKRSIWGDHTDQFDSQANIMMRKNLFNPADPNNTAETPWGFVVRFWQNTEIYFSARFWELLNFRTEASKPNTALTIFTILLILPGFVFALIRKNKAVLISFLYFSALCAVTFVALHTSWGQARLVMIYFPFIFITIFYGFWELFRTKALGGFKFFYVILLAIFLIPNLLLGLEKIPKNLPILLKNISGDEFYGYTMDWKNFFKASRWTTRNLPEDSFVASRRAPMSFIYGDFKEFFPVYSVPSNNADSLMNNFKKHNVTHVILAELRVNPARYIPNRYINTLHRYVAIIAAKYPQAFELIHTEGIQEKAEVYKIHYEHAIPTEAVKPQTIEQNNGE
jgi:hypothetical protein